MAFRLLDRKGKKISETPSPEIKPDQVDPIEHASRAQQKLVGRTIQLIADYRKNIPDCFELQQCIIKLNEAMQWAQTALTVRGARPDEPEKNPDAPSEAKG